MRLLTGRFPSDTGQDVFYRIWQPEKEPKAVIQIIHGMAEHSERYAAFAEFLCNNGFIVAANDHPGHGITGYDADKLMYFDEKEGWIKVSRDLTKFNQQLRITYDLPLIILGHSMGSFFARYLLIKKPQIADGWILSGTANFTLTERIGGFALANISLFFKDPKEEAGFIHKIGFKAYNNKFKSEGNEFAWLGTDKEVIDEYVKDPLCGNVATGAFYRDLFYGINIIQKRNELKKMPNDSKVLFISGKDDPVGNFGKGVKKVIGKFEKSGLKPEFSIFHDMRHEIILEKDKEFVWSTVLDFCKRII